MAPYVPKIRSTYTATSHSTLDGLRQRECLAYIQTSVLSAAPLPAFSPKPPPSFLRAARDPHPVLRHDPFPLWQVPHFSRSNRMRQFLWGTQRAGDRGPRPLSAHRRNRRADRQSRLCPRADVTPSLFRSPSSDLGACTRPISNRCFSLTPAVHRCRAIVHCTHTKRSLGLVADRSAVSCHCE